MYQLFFSYLYMQKYKKINIQDIYIIVSLQSLLFKCVCMRIVLINNSLQCRKICCAYFLFFFFYGNIMDVNVYI
jgi:hypothetical protein